MAEQKTKQTGKSVENFLDEIPDENVRLYIKKLNDINVNVLESLIVNSVEFLQKKYP